MTPSASTRFCMKLVANNAHDRFWDCSKALVDRCPLGKADCSLCIEDILLTINVNISRKITASRLGLT